MAKPAADAQALLERSTRSQAARTESDTASEGLPPDPIERGTCSLEVQVSGDGGELRKGVKLDLWRIGAPANEHYGVGDQRVAEGYERNGQVAWQDLAEGTYRIFCPDARRDSEDAPTFVVQGASTRIRVAIAEAREMPVFVRVVDEYGADLVEGEQERGGASTSGSWEPPWSVQRPLARGGWWDRGGCTSSGRSSPVHARRVVAGPDGFPLGTQREAARGTRWTDRWTLSFAARTSVDVQARSHDARFPGPLRYVAVSIPLDPIASSVRMEDGRLASQGGAKISAVCEAVLVPQDGAWLDPRKLPLKVKVTLAGHAPLEFTTTLDEPVTQRLLVKATPGEREGPPRGS